MSSEPLRAVERALTLRRAEKAPKQLELRQNLELLPFDYPLEATQHIRRMWGGTQPHLMGCSDGNHYIVKFPNNPQGARALVNELLCARLCRFLKLPVPPFALVSVDDDLIQSARELYIEMARGNLPCEAGLCYGSQYPHPDAVIFDSPKAQNTGCCKPLRLRRMVVFDIWTSNIDFRQVRFVKVDECWRAIMFDNSLAFRGEEWAFCDKPRLVVNPLLYVYEFIGGMSSFDPWLTMVESIKEDDLWHATIGIPDQWYGADVKSLGLLLEQLWIRRLRVRDLICSLHLHSPGVFPNWKLESALATAG